MKKIDLFWQSNRDWWEYKDHVPTVREDAPPEAKESYERYLKQTSEEQATNRSGWWFFYAREEDT